LGGGRRFCPPHFQPVRDLRGFDFLFHLDHEPGSLAILVASMSRQNKRNSSRNLAAEIRERRKYRFRIVIIGFIACSHMINESSTKNNCRAMGGHFLFRILLMTEKSIARFAFGRSRPQISSSPGLLDG
jgi:hypothetical protein